MKTRTLTQTFALALAMMFTLTIGSSVAFGQDKDDKQSADSLTVEQSKTVDNEGHGNTLVGVWQSVSPTVDCQTGEPNSPPIRVLFNFMQGGTMSESDTNSIDGPYRAPSEGIWKRTSGRNYTAVYLYYAFDPDRTFTYTIRLRENIKLSRDRNSFTGIGTFEVLDARNNDNVVFSGCFTDKATRLQF